MCGWTAVVAHGVVTVGAAAISGAKDTVPAATSRPTMITHKNLRKDRPWVPFVEIQCDVRMIASFRAVQVA
jgi:hypothetical protein